MSGEERDPTPGSEPVPDRDSDSRSGDAARDESDAAGEPPSWSAGGPTAIEIELEGVDDGAAVPRGLPVGDDLRRLVETACAAANVTDGHVAITIVDADAIHALNLEHRGKDKPTDVLSFPIDGAGPVAGPREIGDVVICPEHTVSLREAVVHGILHLVGFDHETDDGEMLAVQAQILQWLPEPATEERG